MIRDLSLKDRIKVFEVARLSMTQCFKKTILPNVLLLLLASSLSGITFASNEDNILSSLQDHVLVSYDVSDDADSFDSSFIPITSFVDFTQHPANSSTLPLLSVSGLNVWNTKSIRAPPTPIV